MPDMLNQPYWTLAPMMVVAGTGFIVMILELIFRQGEKRWLNILSMIGVLCALVITVSHLHDAKQVGFGPVETTIFVDAFTTVFSSLILIAAFLVLLFTMDYRGKHHLATEHTYLILFGVVGAMTMASSVDLVTLYVGLELLSVASYVLVGIRHRSVRSIEGGIKYMLMGAIGSAVLLYGMSFLYGISGSTNLITIANATGLYQQYPGIMALSFVLILAGMGFKLSLVPFHMWTPDAYDGAPTAMTSFVATLSKVAAFGMLFRILLFVFHDTGNQMFLWAGIIAAITMVVGNFIALPQKNMKRLLAFSSVAQAGYILIPFALLGTAQQTDWNSLINSIAFYLFAYTFMTIGALAIVYVVERDRGSVETDALTGLYQRSPWLAVAMTVFVLSLAGMPLTAGFLGKFYIFVDALHMGNLWLGILLFATSVVSFFYYIGLIRKVYQPLPIGDVTTPEASSAMHVLVALCLIGTIVLGIVPGVLLHQFATIQWI